MKSENSNIADPMIARGSVLAIPLDNNQWALGSVISPGVNFFIGFCLDRFVDPIKADDIRGKNLKIFSWTNDAEVYRGNWKNLGVSEIIKNVTLPEYKIFVNGCEMVESFDQTYIRQFNPNIDENLKFRKIRSPLLVQDAVQAACGLGDWKVGFQDMLL